MIPASFQALGFDRITYFCNLPLDAWAYIVEGADIVVLAFRGTESITNWRTDFQVEMVHPQKTDPRLRVHKGFLAVFNEIDDGPQGLGNAIQQIKGVTKEKGIPIYITGHSLGGALAQIAAAIYGSDQIAACYTFGSPRVGNAYFDLWVKPPSYRVENYADIVPQIPWFAPHLPLPIPYRHSGDPRYLPEQSQSSPYRYEPGLVTRGWQLLKGLIQFAEARAILGIRDHAVEKYEHKLADIAGVRTQAR